MSFLIEILEWSVNILTCFNQSGVSQNRHCWPGLLLKMLLRWFPSRSCFSLLIFLANNRPSNKSSKFSESKYIHHTEHPIRHNFMSNLCQRLRPVLATRVCNYAWYWWGPHLWNIRRHHPLKKFTACFNFLNELSGLTKLHRNSSPCFISSSFRASRSFILYYPKLGAYKFGQNLFGKKKDRRSYRN